MPHADNCSPGRAEPYPPSEISPHIHSAGSVAVLVNVETTPVQLHATLFPSGNPAGRGISSYLLKPASAGVPAWNTRIEPGPAGRPSQQTGNTMKAPMRYAAPWLAAAAIGGAIALAPIASADGSPTILINGADPFAHSQSPVGLSPTVAWRRNPSSML